MKSSFISKAIIASILSLGLLVSAAGCSNSDSKPETVTSNVTSENSKEESKIFESSVEDSKPSESSVEESSAPESSSEESKLPESSVEESSKEESTRVLFNTETDMQLTTLSVSEVPYDSNLINSKFKSYSNVKVITALMSSSRFYGIKNGKPSIKLADGSTGTSRYSSVMSSVKKNSDEEFTAYAIEIVCDPELNPSDFCFSFSFRDEKHQVPLSDTVTSLPEEYTFDGTDENNSAQIYNIVSLDGHPYYIAGLTHGSTSFSSDSKSKSEKAIKPLSFRYIIPDGTTKIDLDKLSFEPDEAALEGLDTSKVSVDFKEAEVVLNDRYFSEVIEIIYEIKYDANADEKTIDTLKNNLSKVFSDGYLVYTGDNGKKVRIHL